MHYIMTPAQLNEYRNIHITREAREKARADATAELGRDPFTTGYQSAHARQIVTKHYAIANLPLTNFLNTCERPSTSLKTRSSILWDAGLYLHAFGFEAGAVLNITLNECTQYFVTQHWYLSKEKGRWYYRQSQNAKAKHLIFTECADADEERQYLATRIPAGVKQ